MVIAPKNSISGEASACCSDIAQIAGLEPVGRQTETVRFHILGAERLHHLMPADGLLQNLVQFSGFILRAARGAADAAADAQRGDQHERAAASG